MEDKSLVEVFEELIRRIESEPQSVEDIKKIYKLSKRLNTIILSLIEYHLRHGEDSFELKRIHRELSKENVSSTLQAIANLGSKLRDELGDDFRKMGYRILEQIRAGKRKDVEYSIVRIFITNEKNVPNELLEAFKPRYDDNTFRAFMYAFIGSVIKPKETKKED